MNDTTDSKTRFQRKIEATFEKLDEILLGESETLKGERVFLTVFIYLPTGKMRLALNYGDMKILEEILKEAKRQVNNRSMHTPLTPTTVQ